MRITWLLIFVTLTLYPFSSEVFAGRYRQPAYVTNGYFSTAPADNISTGKMINIIPSNNPNAFAYLILDLIIDEGQHKFSIDVLDKHAKKIAQHDFPDVHADRNDYPLSIDLKLRGQMPAGGIFFKLYDQHDSGQRIPLDTFRIFSADKP